MPSEQTVPIDPAVAKSELCSQLAKRPLRITCYGSSSAKTPDKYLQEARSLGYILAKRGHVCVNGAGSYGCMAAMNDGAVAGNGHIVGVIHEMFLVDNGYGGGDRKIDRDGGAHQAFDNIDPSNNNTNEGDGPIREILVAGGDDLQQRKKLLVDKSDGLVVLPGGPGTWDELWEMACARHLGLVDLPIVCVNVDNYYAPFLEMLDRAYKDELIKLMPHQIVHFAPSAEEAVRWIEGEKDGRNNHDHQKPPIISRQSSAWRRSSFFSPLIGESEPLSSSSASKSAASLSTRSKLGLMFTAGLAVGVALTFAWR